MPHGHHLKKAAALSIERVKAIYETAKQVEQQNQADAALNAGNPPNPQPLGEPHDGPTAGTGPIQQQSP